MDVKRRNLFEHDSISELNARFYSQSKCDIRLYLIVNYCSRINFSVMQCIIRTNNNRFQLIDSGVKYKIFTLFPCKFETLKAEKQEI